MNTAKLGVSIQSFTSVTVAFHIKVYKESSMTSVTDWRLSYMHTFQNIHLSMLLPFTLMRLDQFSVINYNSLNPNCNSDGVHIDQFDFIMADHRLIVRIQKSGLEISVVPHPVEVSQRQ
jgi:hypothetical protein